MLDQHQDIEQPKRHRDRDKEVACHNSLRMVAQEGRPALITARSTRRSLGHVLADGTWRDMQTKFSRNSLAILSSPQSGFSVALRRINRRSSSGIRGRPGLDLQRQNRRQPARCQRINVSGRTTTRALRQSNSRESNASETRVAASMRLGLMPRPWYSASSRRRKRFSASTDRRGLTDSTTRPARSASNRRMIRTKTITLRSCHSSAKAAPRGQSSQDRIFAEGQAIRAARAAKISKRADPRLVIGPPVAFR